MKAKKLYNYDGYPIWKNWSLHELTTKMAELVNEADDAMNEAEEFEKEINHRKKR